MQTNLVLIVLVITVMATALLSTGASSAGQVVQLPLPTTVGQTFVIDDFDNKVTQTDMGFNYFMGNTGATESAEDITALSISTESNGSQGGSLQIEFDFAGQPDEGPFAGYFGSLFALTDTNVSFNPKPNEPPETTPFPGYFLDLLDIYRGSLIRPDRSVEQLKLDVRVVAATSSSTPMPDFCLSSPTNLVHLKIELTEEKVDPSNPKEQPHRVYARRAINSTEWQTLSLTLPNESGVGDFTGGNTSSFNPRRVSLLALIVERCHGADSVRNHDTGTFLVDNLRLIDKDGEYPDLAAIRDPGPGDPKDEGLLPEYTDAFLDLVRATSFQYFLDFASTDPRTGGIIQDRSTFADLMTVGGVGFQLTAYVIGAERGYIDRDDAAERVRSILAVLNNVDGAHPHGAGAVGNIGHNGFFYHFLGIDGLRKHNFDFEATSINESRNTVELSTIDTALAIAGVITAGRFFDGQGSVEGDIRSWADEIYERVDWPFMLDDETNQFFLGWKPLEDRDGPPFEIPDNAAEGAYSGTIGDPNDPNDDNPATLDFYTDEGLLVALLAVASPTHPVAAKVFCEMERQGTPFVKTFPGALFTYQFASVWLNTQALGPDACPEPLNYFENTRSAILATQQYAIDNPNLRETLNGKKWGLSAAEGPFDDYFAEAAPSAAVVSEKAGGQKDVGQCLGSSGPFALEAEHGTGQGQKKPRGNASGQQTIWLHDGESRTLPFELDGTAKYEMVVRYSNDGPPDKVLLSVDGVSVGQFATQDTRPPGGVPGSGWNAFFTSETLGPIILPPGQHELVVLANTDFFGVEIDVVTLEPLPVVRPLEVGTVTVYGVGSSIVHTPDEAIAALWEAQRLGLLHPRFGFADAFNLDIADAVIPGCVDLNESRVLRAAGPWKQFNGFAIDHGPMLILIDNYLADHFVPGLFMSYLNTSGNTLNALFPSDADSDGCTDGREVGPKAALGGLRDPNSFWDFFDVPVGGSPRDQRVDGFDIGAVVLRFGAFVDPPPTKEEALAQALTPPPDMTSYHAAYDRGGPIPGQNLWNLLPPNGPIDAFDIGAVVVQFGHTCL